MKALHAVGSGGVGDVAGLNAAGGKEQGLVGLVDEAVGEFDFVVLLNGEGSFKLNAGGKGFDDGGLVGFGFAELEGVVFFESGDALIAEGGLVVEGEGDGLALGAVFSVVVEKRYGGDSAAAGTERELKLIVFEGECLFGGYGFL